MNKIKEKAKENKITITKLAEETKMARSYLYDIMNEVSYPTIPTARKLAKELKTTIDELFPC